MGFFFGRGIEDAPSNTDECPTDTSGSPIPAHDYYYCLLTMSTDATGRDIS